MIANFTVVEKFIKDARWYVRLAYGEQKKTIPNANYVWLKGNPSFSEIPKGYVVHHLDLDPLNDDISNLALMAKYHHTAYHWKHKNICVPVVIDPELGLPIEPPRICEKKDRNAFVIYYKVKVGEKNKRKFLYKLDGKKLSSREDAEAACVKLWPHLYRLRC